VDGLLHFWRERQELVLERALQECKTIWPVWAKSGFCFVVIPPLPGSRRRSALE